MPRPVFQQPAPADEEGEGGGGAGGLGGLGGGGEPSSVEFGDEEPEEEPEGEDTEKKPNDRLIITRGKKGKIID